MILKKIYGALTVNNFNVILYDISKGQNSSQAETFQVETSQLKILPAKWNKMTFENVESCKIEDQIIIWQFV